MVEVPLAEVRSVVMVCRGQPPGGRRKSGLNPAARSQVAKWSGLQAVSQEIASSYSTSILISDQEPFKELQICSTANLCSYLYPDIQASSYRHLRNLRG